MTTTIPDVDVQAINHLDFTPICQAIDNDTHEACSAPAAWALSCLQCRVVRLACHPCRVRWEAWMRKYVLTRSCACGLTGTVDELVDFIWIGGRP